MRRVALVVVAVVTAILLQVMLLDRVPFPGGAAPDLVLVLVAVLSLATGPMEGMLIGFGAGLALDLAPPGSSLVGLSALVFCLVGYGAGRLRGPLERSAWLPLAAVMAVSAAGEALYAMTGMIFGDPGITLVTVRRVLPASVVYDILLSPFVLFAVARLGGFATWPVHHPSRGGLLTGGELVGAGLAGGAALAGVAAAGGVVRDTGSGRGPRIRASAGRRADGWIGTGQRQPGQAAIPVVHGRRAPHLRGGVAGSAAGGQVTRGPVPARPARIRFSSSRHRDGVVGVSARSGGSGGGRGRGPRAGAFRSGPSAMARGGARRARIPRLRWRGHRGDGVVGGGVGGGGGLPRGSLAGSRRLLPGRAPGTAGALRPGRGRGPGPAFRVRRRGLLRRGGGLGARLTGGGGLGGRARPGGRNGLGGAGRLGGRGGRWGGRRWPWRTRPGRRSVLGRLTGKRTGGL